MSPKIVDKEKKKRQILLAAMKVFSEKGVKSSRMADIAHRAEIGKGTIYEYFRNRDEILVDAFFLIMGDMESKINTTLKDIENPREQISAMVRVTYEMLLQSSLDYLEIFLDFWSEGIRRRNESKQSINLSSLYDEYRRQISGILEEGVRQGQFRPMDTTSVASTIMAIIDGLLLQIILDRKLLDDCEVIEEALGMVLNGIINKNA